MFVWSHGLDGDLSRRTSLKSREEGGSVDGDGDGEVRVCVEKTRREERLKWWNCLARFLKSIGPHFDGVNSIWLPP